jgi:hypothetical protein
MSTSEAKLKATFEQLSSDAAAIDEKLRDFEKCLGSAPFSVKQE